MASKSILLLALVICSISIALSHAHDLRLIEFGEGKRIQIPAEDVPKLIKPGRRNNFIDVTDFPEPFGPLPNTTRVPTIPPAPRHQEIVDRLLPQIKVEELTQTINELSQFYTRYYTTQTGLQAANFLRDKYDRYSLDRTDVEVTLYPHTWLQPSVIARIQGSGPNEDELVILGGHEDSINLGSLGRAPGCDDDASGSSTVLEVFRLLVASGFKPQRTLEFHAYAAEEAGLLGSQAIANAYRAQGKIVAGMVQFDMTGYVAPGATPNVGLMQDFVNPALTTFLGQLIDTYTNIGWVATRCGYGCSDHASWFRAGFPACMPAEGPFSQSNPNIHTTRDTMDKLDMEHAVEFAKIGLAFAVEMGLVD